VLFRSMPDVTFLLDLPADIGLARAGKRGAADRMEQESLDFHERVRDGFLALAKSEPNRIKVVEAQQSIEAISADIVAQISPLLESLS